MIKEGTIWRDHGIKRFQVIKTVEVNGESWVHYREYLGEHASAGAKEFSCFEASFKDRFTPVEV